MWLLHPDYFVPSIGKNCIIPEIDFAGCNNKRIDNVVHYGYDKERYSAKGKINHIHKTDENFTSMGLKFCLMATTFTLMVI